VIQDLWLACRAIARMPLVAATVVLSLAAGIGANVVAFSWLEARVLHPLPGVSNAAALYQIEPRHRRSRAYVSTSWLEYEDLARDVTSFRGLVAFRMTPFYVGDAGDVDRPYGQYVSANFFEILGVTPAVGRGFRPEDTLAPGTPPVVVVSFTYWQSRLGGAPDAIGRSLRINGVPLTIVGVTPRGFQGPILGLDFQLWVPATMAAVLEPGTRDLVSRDARGYTVMGWLEPGSTRERATAEVADFMGQLESRHPVSNGDIEAEVLPFWESPRGPQRMFAQVLIVLQAIMLLLFVAVCGNVANLLLARASRREREMALRAALGGSRLRLARLVLAESAVLSLAGALVGGAVAVWATEAFWSLPITGFPIRLDSEVTVVGSGFAVLLGLGAGLACGAAPAIRLARTPPSAAIRGEDRLASGPGRLGRALTGLQMALAMVVLVIAALFLRQFAATRDADPGFRRDGVLLVAYDLAGQRPDRSEVRARTSAILEAVRPVPGVTGAAISSTVPLDIHGLPSRTFDLEGRAADDDRPDRVLTNVVSPGYFDVMQIGILEGRDFSALEDPAAPVEVVVNEAFVERYLDDLPPIGRRIDVQGFSGTIAGVSRTTRYNTIDEPPTPAVYFSYRDRPVPTGELHVTTATGREHAIMPAVRRAIRDVYPDVPVFNPRSMAEHIDSNLVLVTVPARMFSVLAPLLLLLAAAGITAVVSHAAAARTMEIGVRMALGATRGRVVRDFVRDSLGPVAIGTLAGWSVALLAASAFMPGTIDLWVFGGVPVLLLTVSAAAAWWPAWQAAGLNPVAALRAQ
jgi:predicted permease